MKPNTLKKLLPLFLLATLSSSADIGLNQETPYSLSPIMKGDFNGDNITDILTRNKITGHVYTLLLNADGTTASLQKIISGLPSSEWEILDTAYFNSRNNASEEPYTEDILVRRKSDGNLYTLLMNSDGTATIHKLISGLLSSNWEILETGNFNADTSTDILVRRKSDGNLYTILVSEDGTSGTLNKIASGLLSSEWDILKVEYFNDDGREDILVQRKSDGNLYTLLVNEDGTSVTFNKIISNVPSSDWNILEVARVDVDNSTPDIILQRKSDGNLYIALINYEGTVATLHKIVSGIPASEWNILKVGNLHNDGGIDILAQRKSDGNIYTILINETGTIASLNKIVSGLSSNEWSILTNKSQMDNIQMRNIPVQRKSDGSLYNIHLLDDGITASLNKIASNLSTDDWNILYADDFNGDWILDVLVQRKSDGNLYTINLDYDGLASNFNKIANGLPSSEWEIKEVLPDSTPIEEIVQRHNVYRNLDFQDSNLTWDSTLATHAQQWAEYLVNNYTATDRANDVSPHAVSFNKDTHGLPYEGEGENIAWSSNGRGYLTPEPVDITVAGTGGGGSIDAWANEKANYDYGTNATTDALKAVGHYTQVAWQKTTKVGCGKATGGDGEYVVCRYSIAGNMKDDKPYCTEYSVAPYYTDASLQFTSAIINNQTFINTKLIEDRTNCTTSEISSETLVFNSDGSGTFQSFDFFNDGGYVVNFNFTSIIENGVLKMTGVVNDMDSFITLNLVGQDSSYYYAEAEWSLDKTNQGYYRRAIFKLAK